MLKDKTKGKNSIRTKRKLTRSEKKQIAELIRKANKLLNLPKNTIPTSMALKLPLRPTYPDQSLPS